MSPDDLQHIESTLNIRLPADYRRLMLDYPFGEDSFAQDCELPDEAARLITDNLELRQEGFFGSPWPALFFAIGGDGSGNCYYLDLAQQPSPVFLADHESSQTETLAPHLESWIAQLQKEYAAWDAEEPQRRARPWWRFW